MKQHIIILIILFFGSALTLAAQQPAQYSLFMMNKLNWNPAYAGMENSLVATGIYRSQWQGIEGNPITQNISVHLPINIISSGFGLNLENDELGAQSRTTGTAMYNYQMALGRRAVLAMGVSAGLSQRTLDGSKLRTPEGDYVAGTIIHNDDLLPITPISGSLMTYGAGVYFLSERLEMGFSVRHLTEPSAPLSDALSMQLNRAYFFNAQAHFDIGNSLSFHPAALLRSDGVQFQTDLAALFRYNDNISAGASLRGYNSNSLDAIALLVGFKLNDHISAAYAYDFTLSAINQVSNGSHEIMLSYNLNRPIGKGRPPKIIYNPRSL
jgi:type IX secretion system PorP/SprF family membrane protein